MHRWWARDGGSCREVKSIQSFAKNVLGTLVRPTATFREMTQEKPLGQGWAAVLLLAILYTAVCAINAAKGITPVNKPFLPISEESYYFWETFFGPPLFVGLWFLFAWLNLLIGRAFGGQGSFRGVLVPLAFALYIPMIPIMWTTDFVSATFMIDLQTMGAFGQVWGIFYWAFSVLWIIVASVIATREVHRLSVAKATATALTSAIPVTAIVAVTIR